MIVVQISPACRAFLNIALQFRGERGRDKATMSLWLQKSFKNEAVSDNFGGFSGMMIMENGETISGARSNAKNRER